MSNELSDAKPRMQKAFEYFEDELKKIKTGRANPAMLHGLSVNVYGQAMPLNHIANVVAADAKLLQVTPFDPNNLDAISAAIREDSSLGLNPSDDGKVIRVPIPDLTTERRQEIVKQVGEKAEETKIALRNIRHDILRSAQAREKEGEITKDDLISTEKELNKLIDEFQTKIDEAAKSKEDELMTV